MLRVVRAHRVARALVAGLVLSLTGASAALALTPPPSSLPQSPIVDITRQLVDLRFPLADPDDGVRFGDDFLALRGGGARLHAATDVMAPKHRPIHAAVGGTISSAPETEPSYGWMLSIRGDDGFKYSYIHINNDTPQRDANGRWLDDDKGGIEHAFAPRIVEAIRSTGSARGVRVERGELIAWVGDSGNAKNIASHLHLEMEATGPDGTYRVNPYDSLMAALERDDVPGSVVAARETEGGYSDVYTDGVHTPAIVRLSEAGVVTSCEPARYCPGDDLTRGDLAAFLAAARGLTTGGTADFTDVSDHDPNAGAIAAVVDAGMLRGFGDGTFRPDWPLDRAQLATVLVQGFDLPAISGDAPFGDVDRRDVHAANIAAAFEAGLTQGCGDGTNYCGRDAVTRAQIASLLVGAIDATG